MDSNQTTLHITTFLKMKNKLIKKNCIENLERV